MGRPSSFAQEIADVICERLAQGESLRRICLDDSMPDKKTVLRWLSGNEAFRAQYARAREDQADHYAEEIVDISNEQSVCYTESGNAFDPDVQRDRLRIDARKWFASKVAPKKYGDKIDISADVAVTTRAAELSDDELATIASTAATAHAVSRDQT